ncbi:MAG TPA: SDR family oxidoreductase [Burkholderiales bacterium]|nr:SDR family oxidoreductase [Burkholderiales bacterium]
MKPIALVFGGSRGIGAACVDALKNEFDVAFTSVSGSAGHKVDIQNAEEVKDVFESVEKQYGRKVDCVVVNAGINVPPGPMAQFDAGIFRKLVDVNIVGAFNVLGEAARRVADGGSIIALSTSLVRHAAPGLGPYSATKAAVESLARSMAKELAPRKVRVNCVAPGPVDTDLFHAGKTDEAKARMAALSPLNRIGQPKEVAEVVAFLASSRASWIQGQVVQPNGGMI